MVCHSEAAHVRGDSGVAAANLVERASRLFSRASVSSKPVLLTSVFQWAEANGLSLVKSPATVRDDLRLRMETVATALAPEQGQCRLDSIFTDGSVIMSDLEVRDALSSRESLSQKTSGAFSVVANYT